ncbi:chondroitin sulfate synthase 1 [Brachionus plicatilis]|uniref:Hexosyltransferase n=1 Tax=Brachionus plicatilis TaxID=10195 RepID=A0A3M7SY92_BRAPC|nr:chondroitin sulfate synthase 1 [Brachionus plicatilis]
MIIVNSTFSRALAGNSGASNHSPNSLLFFIDLDMVFSQDLLSRIRFNTIKNKQVYFPIVFSQYNPKFILNLSNKSTFQINSDLGYWRHFGFGMVSVYKSDFDRIGKFNTKFKGWGGEDFDLYSRFKRFKLTIFRAPEPGLVHVFHDFNCDFIRNIVQRYSCFRSSSNSHGSTRTFIELFIDKIL